MYRFKFECPHCQHQIGFSLRSADEKISVDKEDAENLKTLVDLIDVQNQKIQEAKSQLESIKSKKKELLKQYLDESRQTQSDYDMQRIMKVSNAIQNEFDV